MLKWVGAAVLAVLLGACASPLSGDYAEGSNGKTLLVTKQVWGFYQEYVGKISSVNRGAFAVAVTGGVGVSAYYTYCPGTTCFGGNYGGEAVKGCRNAAAGFDCILFANSADIVVNYKIADW